jgi:hypothetical protein
VALVVYALARKATVRTIWNTGAALSLLVIFSVLPNPEAWWARLAPQFWLVPVIMIAAMATGSTGWPRRSAAALLLLLLVNSLIVAALNWGRAVEKNLAFRGQLAELQKISPSGKLEITTDPRFRMVTNYRLQENAIRFQPVVEPSCPEPFRFSYPNYPARAQAAACPSL